jgi:thiaminase
MFLATQFDKYINAHYNMNVVNQNKYQKIWGQGNQIIKKKEKHMNNQDYIRYIFWIVLSVIIVSTLTGS